MFDWLRALSSAERKTFIAAFGGWSVDALDVMVYTFVIPTLITAWGMSKGQAGFVATAALLRRGAALARRNGYRPVREFGAPFAGLTRTAV